MQRNERSRREKNKAWRKEEKRQRKKEGPKKIEEGRREGGTHHSGLGSLREEEPVGVGRAHSLERVYLPVPRGKGVGHVPRLRLRGRQAGCGRGERGSLDFRVGAVVEGLGVGLLAVDGAGPLVNERAELLAVLLRLVLALPQRHHHHADGLLALGVPLEVVRLARQAEEDVVDGLADGERGQRLVGARLYPLREGGQEVQLCGGGRGAGFESKGEKGRV